jgi:hypothetical protein
MEGYSTQDALHGATQGPTQDANQYPPDERPVAEGNSPGEAPEDETPSPAPGEPASGTTSTEPGEAGHEAQLENAETSLDEPSDGSGGE